jgi:tetratricopeptide (TPR) repeat protein
LLVHAIAEDPWLPHLSKNLGDVHYRNAKYDEAWDAYQRVIRLRPEFGDDVYFRLGNIAYRRMDRESAVALWRQALALNPGHELARTNLDTLEALT